MAIAKIPKQNQNDSKEKAEEAFINNAGKLDKTITNTEQEEKVKPILIRFDTVLLGKIDEAAKKRGVTRSAWVKFVISHALEQGDI